MSILNVTIYATQVNRQHINVLMDTMEKMHWDVMTLYSIMHPLHSSLHYQQIVPHTQFTLANLWDSLYYMREVALHTMDYIDATTTGILSPHVLSVEDLREMLKHIEETLPSTMHLPISSKDALHFCRYLCTHVLIADEQIFIIGQSANRIVYNKWKYMKYLIWIYHTEISPQIMAYKTSTLA